jgi:uncharacterized protein (DUF58 family)
MLRPRQGRVGLLGVLLAVRRDPETERVGRTSVGSALTQVARVARQRSLTVVVSDFRGPRDWRAPLLRLASRHAVVAVEIRDPREQELPNVGHVWLVDPETGRKLHVDTGRRRLRERFAETANAERADLARELASFGVPHVVLSTGGDWLRSFAAFMGGGNRELRKPVRSLGTTADPGRARRLLARAAASDQVRRSLHQPGSARQRR